MISRAAALLAIPAVFALNAGNVAGSPDAALKCGAPSNYPPLLAIDGLIVGPLPPANSTASQVQITLGDHVERDRIHSLEIACMNRSDSTFSRTGTIQVVSIWTLDGPVAQMKSVLAAIQHAQHAYYESHARYRNDLDGLELPALPAGVSLAMEGTDTAWVASATVDGKLMRCRIFEGPPPGPGTPGEPRCNSS